MLVVDRGPGREVDRTSRWSLLGGLRLDHVAVLVVCHLAVRQRIPRILRVSSTVDKIYPYATDQVHQPGGIVARVLM
ncbi:hypothetical protein [Kibdelosporangium philippinense]|uniref:hypothetical protein n=1 Tax=Kibdelosporangium philippinense TaxID=211113 RepID=UPI003613AAB0